MTVINHLKNYTESYTSVFPLITFRILFGLLLSISTIRFIYNGWVEEFYIKPKIFFPYHGFEWVVPLPGNWMYLLFGVMLLSAILITIGFWYRLACILFFLSFTWVELIDKTNYLNHYYFVSIVAFLLIFLPADSYFSFRKTWSEKIPRWTIDILKFHLGLVYFFAGYAKLNYDWLSNALPLKLWLPAQSHMPIIGPLLTQEWLAYAFSYAGAFFDLFIIFFLWNKKTVKFAYVFVLFFHIMTSLLFPRIGVFPYMMIFLTIIFFSDRFHKGLISKLNFWKRDIAEPKSASISLVHIFLIVFTFIQVLLPFRYLLNEGNVFWTEESYRFSWRVMLMEKAGDITFWIEQDDKKTMILNQDYLSPLQERMMSTQPDMILQFSHFLGNKYSKEKADVKVYADSFVSLNGRKSQRFIKDEIDLMQVSISDNRNDYLMPFEP